MAQRRMVPRSARSYEIRIVGKRWTPVRDFYHHLLRWRWPATLGTIALGYLAANALFAVAFALSGGVSNVEPGSFIESFYFSVQTMGTIGYGTMTPVTTVAHILVILESITGLVITALSTGLVFAKFSLPTARVVFSRNAVIHPMNGVPTLVFRIGNARSNQLVDVEIRCIMYRTEHLAEGGVFYRAIDLPPSRTRALSLARSWNVMHPIDGVSPLAGATPESLESDEVEVHVLIVGMDDTTMQLVHAGHVYACTDILWNRRHADVLTEAEDGNMLLDLTRFSDTLPVE